MKPKIRAVKGARDFYPEQMAFRTWLYGKVRGVAERFGYQEYDGPFLETLELYAAKSGEELVKEQAFVFDDRGGDRITLRPELTPSLARMVAQRQAQLGRPIRWWSFGPFWRYERPQKGRSREFFQWNIDLLGSESALADAELAAVSAEFFRSVGLTPAEVRVQINNRRLMDARMQSLGIRAERTAIFRLIDKREKLSATDWEAYARESAGLSSAQVNDLRELLSSRDLWKESDELVQFFERVAALGADDYVEYDASIVRGLDYYTGTVYEARDRDSEFRAIFGGGRYDNLVGEVGGERLPGVGFAMGDVVIGLVLQKYGKSPTLPTAPAQVLVTLFDAGSEQRALALSNSLRAAGLNVEVYPDVARLERQLKYADGKGIRFAAIVGPEEARAGVVTLKDLGRRTQSQIAETELAERIRQMLAGAS